MKSKTETNVNKYSAKMKRSQNASGFSKGTVFIGFNNKLIFWPIITLTNIDNIYLVSGGLYIMISIITCLLVFYKLKPPVHFVSHQQDLIDR